jgi:hypothetical protein
VARLRQEKRNAMPENMRDFVKSIASHAIFSVCGFSNTVRTPRWMTEPPAEFAARCSGGKDGGEAALENAARFPLSHPTATAGILGKNNNPFNPVA